MVHLPPGPALGFEPLGGARPYPGRGQRKFATLSLTPLRCPLWTGIWHRTLSSATVTSRGWQTSCVPTPSRRAGPAAPAPGALPTSASGRSRARSSGAQVAACLRTCLSVHLPACLLSAEGPRGVFWTAPTGVSWATGDLLRAGGPKTVDLDLNGWTAPPRI